MTGRTRHRARNWRNRDGSAVVEFAMILPPFILLIVGGFYTAGLAFAASSIQYATLAAARCASVQTTVCTDATSTVAYAGTKFFAKGLGAPVFTYSASGCGHVVSGAFTYVLNTGFSRINVPLTSTACFP